MEATLFATLMADNVTSDPIDNRTENIDDVTTLAENGISSQNSESSLDDLLNIIVGSFQYQLIADLGYYMPQVNLAIGLPGNLLSFVVILRMHPFTTSSLFLCGLAVSDFLYLFINFLYRFAFFISLNTAIVMCTAGEFLTWTLGFISFGFVIILTLERLLAVWKPFQVATILTMKRSVIYISLMILVSSGVSFVLLFSFEMVDQGPPYGFSCMYTVELEVFVKEYWYKIAMFVGTIIPSGVLLISNIIIVVGLKRSRELQRQMTSDDKQLRQKAKQSRQVTIMLVSILVLFILTCFPWGAVQALVSVKMDELGSTKHLWMIFFTTLFINVKDINHSCNCFCYYLSARRFRAGVLDLVTCGGRLRLKRRKSNQPKTQTTVISSLSTAAVGVNLSA